jgi:hypothetical protein
MLEPYFMTGHGNSSSAGGNLNGSPAANASPNVNIHEGVYPSRPTPAQDEVSRLSYCLNFFLCAPVHFLFGVATGF